MSVYQDSGPIDCTGSIDTKGLKGKTAIVTGGASGIGKEYDLTYLLISSCSIGQKDDLIYMAATWSFIVAQDL